MAYIGAAAINMRLKGMKNAKTIHSWIYDMIEVPILDKFGKIVMNEYFDRPEVTFKRIPKDLPDIDLIAIDEGGTVPLNMKQDILNNRYIFYFYKNLKNKKFKNRSQIEIFYKYHKLK